MEQFREFIEKIHKLELKQTEVAGDVSHIKSRLDEGLPKLFLKLDEIAPKVRENSYWVGKMKQGMWWVSIVGIGGSLISLMMFFVKKGMR